MQAYKGLRKLYFAAVLNYKSFPMEAVPFYPLSSFYKKKFGFKIQKIPVTLASTCPNREGLNGMTTCIFCDEWGSSAYPEQAGQDLALQIEDKIKLLGHHRSAENFFVYFQTYTSTFLGVEKIRQAFKTALNFPQVKGLIIGTRPDCISDSTINLINEFKSQTYVAVELGVQTFSDEQLKFLKRGHTNEASLKAIKKIKSMTGVDVGIHLIFGLPNETIEDMKVTARMVNELQVDHVKLHHLHVLRNTPLAEMFHQGTFKPLELEEYSDRVICFLENLSPNISIERLAALSAHWDELVAPEWTKYKLRSREFIIKKMRLAQTFQGKAISQADRQTVVS